MTQKGLSKVSKGSHGFNLKGWTKVSEGRHGMIFRPPPGIEEGRVLKISFGEPLYKEVAMQMRVHKCFPHLVPAVHRSGPDWILMDEAKGETLYSIMKKNPKLGNKVYGRFIGELRNIHEKCGVAHFDAHARNIIYDKETDKISIIDWGFATTIPRRGVDKEVILRKYWESVTESLGNKKFFRRNKNFVNSLGRDIYMGYATEIAPYTKNKTAVSRNVIEVMKGKKVPSLNLDFLIHLNSNKYKNKKPLELAAQSGNIKLVNSYLDAGFSPKSGFPLHYAVRGKNTKIVDKLLEQGVRLDTKTQKNETPLHVAVSVRDANMISHLIKKGAPLKSRNAKGLTPKQLAKKLGEYKLADILRGGPSRWSLLR